MDEYLEQLVARNNPDLMKRINSLKKENPSEEKPKLKKKSKVEHEKPRRSNTGDFEEAKDKTKKKHKKKNKKKVKFEEESSEANTYTQEDLTTLDFIRSIGQAEGNQQEISNSN